MKIIMNGFTIELPEGVKFDDGGIGPGCYPYLYVQGCRDYEIVTDNEHEGKPIPYEGQFVVLDSYGGCAFFSDLPTAVSSIQKRAKK